MGISKYLKNAKPIQQPACSSIAALKEAHTTSERHNKNLPGRPAIIHSDGDREDDEREFQFDGDQEDAETISSSVEEEENLEEN